MSSDCIFCKILNGEAGTEFLHEDDNCVIFRDIHPKANTHLLIVPRRHIPSIIDVTDNDKELISDLILNAKKIAEKLKLNGYNLQINVGKDGGQEIFHLHIHLMSKF